MSKKVLPLQRILVLYGHYAQQLKGNRVRVPNRPRCCISQAKLQHTLYYRHCQDRVRFINCLSQIISDFEQILTQMCKFVAATNQTFET